MLMCLLMNSAAPMLQDITLITKSTKPGWLTAVVGVYGRSSIGPSASAFNEMCCPTGSPNVCCRCGSANLQC